MNKLDLDLVQTFIQSHPDKAARELEVQPMVSVVALIQVLPLQLSRQVTAQMLSPYLARLCMDLPLDVVGGILADTKATQIATILRCMPEPKRRELFKTLPEKKAALCRLLLTYSDDSIGAHMTPDFLMLSVDLTADEALKRFARSEECVTSGALFVVDEQQHLVGIINIQKVLRAKSHTPIAQLMDSPPVPLMSRVSLSVITDNEGWVNNDILPVLNRNKQLVGLLRYADLHRGLALFSDDIAVKAEDNIWSNMSEAYGSSLLALLNLLLSGTTLSR